VDQGLPTETILNSGYITCFAVYATVYFVGVGLWLLIDANKPVVDE
jgi:hypothetical protein